MKQKYIRRLTETDRSSYIGIHLLIAFCCIYEMHLSSIMIKN